jgi:hypothetical protein
MRQVYFYIFECKINEYLLNIKIKCLLSGILLQHRFIMIRNYLYRIYSREYSIFIIFY